MLLFKLFKPGTTISSLTFNNAKHKLFHIISKTLLIPNRYTSSFKFSL